MSASVTQPKQAVVDLLQEDGFEPALDLPADGSLGPSVVEPSHLAGVIPPDAIRTAQPNRSNQESRKPKKLGRVNTQQRSPKRTGLAPIHTTQPLGAPPSTDNALHSSPEQEPTSDSKDEETDTQHDFGDTCEVTRPISAHGAIRDEALNVTLDAEAQQVANYYHGLRSFLKDCRKSRRYLEAQYAKERINEVRELEAKRRIESLNARHAREVQALNEAYRQELEAFRKHREERFREFMNECQQQIEALVAQHAEQERQTREAERAKLAERPRPSHELLSLRRIEDNLSRTESFREAFATRARADALEREEQLAAKDGSHARIAKALAAVYRTQGTELAALKQRHEIKESKLRRALILEEEQLTRKFYNLHAGLVHAQRLQLARLAGLKHYIPPPKEEDQHFDGTRSSTPRSNKGDGVQLPPLRSSPSYDPSMEPCSSRSETIRGESVLFDGDARLSEGTQPEEPLESGETATILDEPSDDDYPHPALYGSPTARRFRHMLRRPRGKSNTEVLPSQRKDSSASIIKEKPAKPRKPRPDMRDMLHTKPPAPSSEVFRDDMSPLEVLQAERELAEQQSQVQQDRDTQLSQTPDRTQAEIQGSSADSPSVCVPDPQDTPSSAPEMDPEHPDQPTPVIPPSTTRKPVMEPTLPGMPVPGTIAALHRADFVVNSTRRRATETTFNRSRTARIMSTATSPYSNTICPLRPTEADLLRMKEAEERARRREDEAKRKQLEVGRRFAQRKREQEQEKERQRQEQEQRLEQQRLEQQRLEAQRRAHDAQMEQQRRSIELYKHQQAIIAANEQARHEYEVALLRAKANFETEHAKQHIISTSTPVHPRLTALYGTPRVRVNIAPELLSQDPNLRPPPSQVAPGRIRWATPPLSAPMPESRRGGKNEELGALAVPLAEQDEVVQLIMEEVEEQEQTRCAKVASDYLRRQAQSRQDPSRLGMASVSTSREMTSGNSEQSEITSEKPGDDQISQQGDNSLE